MNINSIHAYNGVKNKNAERLEKGNNNNNNLRHPLMMDNSVAFKDATNPSTIERLIKQIKNFDYMSTLGKGKQWIEKMGFFVLFLIQDVIGMTIPRTLTGFNRDREVTGKFHIQEGLEVFGREGLTGPAMMAIPAGAFAITAATMGKSTFTNSRLIRSLGKSLTNTIKNVGNGGKSQLKAAYYENGLKQIVKDSLGVDAKPEIILSLSKDLKNFDILKAIETRLSLTPTTVADIEKELGSKYGLEKVRELLKNKKLESTTELTEAQINKLFKALKNKMPEDIATELQGYVNNELLERSGAELSQLNKLKFEDNSFSASEIVKALIKYADDAITNNKNFDKLDADKAEEFMNSMLGKRCVANLSTMAAVLGIMNYLPKLYARGTVAPGEMSKKMAAENQKNCEKKGDVAFTGMMSGLGKRMGKLSNFALAEGEFNGINFSNTIMSGISIVGLTIPRAKRAYERAPEKTEEQRKNEGWFSRMFKKDASEIKEIAVRDPLSALSVVFAVPLLTRAMVKSYEDKSGFVLINHQADEGKGFKKVLKYLNPYNSISVLGNAELDALYGKVDTHSKLVNVCEYLARKGGDLEKIFAKSEFKQEVFNDNTFTLKSIKQDAKAVKNAKIIDFIKSAEGPMQKAMVESLLPTLKKNKALAIAKTLNALPFFLNLVVISPFLLGNVIPRYTYKLTRNASAKSVPPQQNEQIQAMKHEDTKKQELELKSA